MPALRTVHSTKNVHSRLIGVRGAARKSACACALGVSDPAHTIILNNLGAAVGNGRLVIDLLRGLWALHCKTSSNVCLYDYTAEGFAL